MFSSGCGLWPGCGRTGDTVSSNAATDTVPKVIRCGRQLFAGLDLCPRRMAQVRGYLGSRMTVGWLIGTESTVCRRPLGQSISTVTGPSLSPMPTWTGPRLDEA